VLQLDNLAERWRIGPHPLFIVAKQRLGLASSPVADARLLRSAETVQTEAYRQIIVPAENLMYHHLMQSAKQVIATVHNSAAGYRRVMAAFNDLMSGGHGKCWSEPTAGFASIRAPPPKQVVNRGRRPNSELLNLSSLKRGRRDGPGRIVLNGSVKNCSQCKSNGVVATDHRKEQVSV
jgi:hypothetical protein